MLFNVIVILLNYASACLKIDGSFKIYCKDGFYLPWIPEAPKKRQKGTSGSATTRLHSNISFSASLWYSNLSDVSGQLRGGESIQARQLVFQSYSRVLAYQFSNGSSLRPFWWKNVLCPILSFIHSRYTVALSLSVFMSFCSVLSG